MMKKRTHDFDMPSSFRIVRDDGEELFVGNVNEGWRTDSEGTFDGWDDLDITVNTFENVLTDGSTVISKRINSKDRTLSAFYAGAELDGEAQERARRFFNPKHTFKIHHEKKGRTRWVEGELIGYKGASGDTIGSVPEFTATVLCPNPYFHDEVRTDNTLDYASAGMGFPFVSHMRETVDGKRYPVGFIPSIRVDNAEGKIYNIGDVECYYTVRIRAKGEIVNPKISLNGRFVRVMVDMMQGDELLIDFEASPPRVTYNGQNIISSTDRASSFTDMAMAVGCNVFEFDCDNHEDRLNAEVRIEFYPNYLGM